MNRRMGPETETQKAFRELGEAWEKLRDIIYKELATPLVKKLAEILDKIT